MIELKIDKKELERKLAGLVRQIKNAGPVMADFGQHLIRTWTLKFPRTLGHKASASGGPPAIQNAGLKNSLTFEVTDRGEKLQVGTPLIYGAIQHLGGTIRPRRAKLLTIPIAPQSYGKRARDFKDIHRRGMVLGQETGGGGFLPLFALAKEVTLPARPWLLIYDPDWDYLGKRMERHLEEERA